MSGGLAHFGPLAFTEIPGQDGKHENTISGFRGTFMGGKMLPRYPGWFPANFPGFFFVGPPPAGNGSLVGVWLILGLWSLEKFQGRAENTKTQFPGARGT